MKAKTLTLILALSSSIQAENSIHQANNTLGLNLFQELHRDGTNLCLSPYSIQSALSMTLNGAAGETHQEMLKVLNYDNLSNTDINQQFETYQQDLKQRLAKDLPKHQRIDKTSLVDANRIFAQTGRSYEQAFLDACSDSFNAPLKELDFKNASEQSRQHINQWVEKTTKDKIKDLLAEGSITRDTSMVLTNCIHFKASWEKQFSEHATKERDFNLSDGNTEKVYTMYKRARFGYHKGGNYQAVSIPYGYYKQFQFLAILPNEGTSMSQLIDTLSGADFTNMRILPSTDMKLYLPKFKISGASISLTEPLKKLGLKTAFSPRANFSKITSQESLYISDVFHKTFIELDEEGTEAAAATAVAIYRRLSGVINPTPPITVELNRPFFYAIQDTQTGTCFFMGQVQNPLK